MGVSGFTVTTSEVMMSPAVTRASSCPSSQDIKLSDNTYDSAICLNDRHPTILLRYKLKRDISGRSILFGKDCRTCHDF